MAGSWRVGSKARGTRSQFRLGTEGLLPFKCKFPVHLTDVMDLVPSTQSDLRRGELLSPVRGTRTRTVREYEETIESLNKEKFDLQLRLYMLQEDCHKNHQKNKGTSSDELDNSVDVVVNLKTDCLRKELSDKDQMLHEALNEAERYAADLKELQDKYVELQGQLTTITNIPLELEWVKLKDEKEKFEKEAEYLRKALSETELVIQDANSQIEELTNKNSALEAKVEKRSLAIQGLVYKYHKDVEMIPKELRPIVQGAVQAAKQCKEEDLNSAMRELKVSLRKIMPTYVEEVSNDTEEKENKKSSFTQASGKAAKMSPPSNQSLGESSRSHSEAVAKPKFVHASKENSTLEENALSQSSESIAEYAKSVDSEGSENFEHVMGILKDNENLKVENEEKMKTIKNLNASCSELQRRHSQLQGKFSEAVSKIKELEENIKDERSKSIMSSLPKVDTSAQTEVKWHLIQSKQSDDFLQNAGQSNSIDELREEILTLVLLIEQKDKEMSDIEHELGSVRSQLEKVENQKENIFSNADIDNIIERNDLHKRLELSCQVNRELMDHLRKLEDFMEDLLQNKNLDSSSIENISETSDVFLRLTTCLDETKKLSSVLSDHLSICESSKLFDPDVSVSKEDYSQLHKQSHLEDQSWLSLNTSDTHSTSQGRNKFTPDPSKNTSGTGKRRLSFSTIHNTARNTALLDSENAVFLGTSNNEDLILLLNDQGDPKDVVIRNSNNSHNTSNFDKIPDFQKSWESSMCFWNKENLAMDQWGASGMKLLQNRCPSSDSDIWSEPDRDVSLQRIGIDVQMSPISQKSPRRSRMRDKRTTDELSSQKYDSSSSAVKGLSWSKRRKSSETLRSSLTCRKCFSQSLTKDESSDKDRLQKVVDELSNRCSKQENQLDEISEILDNKIHEIESLSREKLELSTSMKKLEKELKGLKEKEKELIIKTSASTGRLTEVSSENDMLKHTIEELEFKAHETDTTCEHLKEELKDTKKRLQELDIKCSQYEKDLSSNAHTLEEYSEKYNIVVEEKAKLIKEIEELVSTKSKLMKSIQEEKSKIQKFETETTELKEKLEEKTQTVASLQYQYEELKAKTEELSNEKVEKENALLSTNSICDKLQEDLKKSQESLENLKNLCVAYEKQLNQSSEFQESFEESLLNVKNTFLSNLKDLAGVCKQYLDNEEERLKDIDNFLSNSLSVTDSENKIEELFTDIINANTKFEQTISFLSEQLSSVSSIRQQFEMDNKEIQSLKTQNSQLNAHIKSLQITGKESHTLIKESKSKIDILQQDLHNAHSDIKDLKNFVEAQQKQVEDMEQSLQDKENLLKQSKIQLSSSEVKLGTVQKQIEKDKQLLNLKDDEIDTLQKRILNYQAKITEFLTEKMENASQVKMNPNEFPSGSVSIFDPSKDITTVSDTSRKSKRQSSQTLHSSSQNDKAFVGRIRLNSDELVQETVSKFDPSKDYINITSASEKSIRPDVQTAKRISESDREIASQIKANSNEFLQDSISTFEPFKQNTNVSALEKSLRLEERSSGASTSSIPKQTRVNINEFAQSTVSTLDPYNDNANVSCASEVSIERDVQSINGSVKSLTSSHSSIISEKDGEHTKSHDKCIKKIKSLRTKLYVTEKRIEMLEKEKIDLRKQVLEQGQDIITSSSSEVDTLKKELSDLKEKLQEKTLFIRDLKSDMFRTCNSLIDKEKEVDNLKRKLSDGKELVAEDRSKSEVNLKSRYSDPLQMATEASIKMLKKQKWEVIHDILSQQKQFYEHKNIHLGHLEKFKKHLGELLALQGSSTLSKSESEPFLNSFTAANNSYAEKCDRSLKIFQIELELDVECLQNFKIFLKRFFIPLVLKNCEQCSKHVDTSSVKTSTNNVGKSLSKSVNNDENCIKHTILEDLKLSDAAAMRDISQHSSNDRLISTASAIAQKIDLIKHSLESAKTLLDTVKSSSIQETPTKINAAKSLLMKICNEIDTQQEKLNEVFHLNSVLKSLGLFDTNAFFSRSKQDISDQESLSEETIPLSRSGSLSPMNFEEHLPFKSLSGKSDSSKRLDIHYPENEKSSKGSYSELAHKSGVAGGSRDSIFQRSHVSSPDQGIESDPNHESSAPEQAEKEDFRLAKRQESGTKQKQWSSERQISSASLYSFVDGSSKLKVSDHSPASGDSLHAIGALEHYELLKKEVQESLVGIKAILSRTGDGLKHVDKYTSPRKNLEYSTFKAIRDTSGNIEVCLIEASKLVDKFWVAPCPSAEELNMLLQQIQDLQEKLKSHEESNMRRENSFKDAMARLKQQEILKQNMEKKISKKLVKTKKVIRQAEMKLLEQGYQEPLIPKYPTKEPTCQKNL